jgi:hypothetical protein
MLGGFDIAYCIGNAGYKIIMVNFACRANKHLFGTIMPLHKASQITLGKGRNTVNCSPI